MKRKETKLVGLRMGRCISRFLFDADGYSVKPPISTVSVRAMRRLCDLRSKKSTAPAETKSIRLALTILLCCVGFKLTRIFSAICEKNRRGSMSIGPVPQAGLTVTLCPMPQACTNAGGTALGMHVGSSGCNQEIAN